MTVVCDGFGECDGDGIKIDLVIWRLKRDWMRIKYSERKERYHSLYFVYIETIDSKYQY